MKKIIVWIAGTFALGLTLSSYAALKGPYLGLGGGYGILQTPDHNLSAINSVHVKGKSFSRGGVAGRVFGGFNFNQYLGLEIGYAQYGRSKYTFRTFLDPNASIRFYANTTDVVLKAYYPFLCNQLSPYILGGYVSVLERVKLDLNTNMEFEFADLDEDVTGVHKARPIYGFGLSYSPFCHFAVNAEVTRVQQSGDFYKNVSNYIPYMDLATINVAYNFG